MKDSNLLQFWPELTSYGFMMSDKQGFQLWEGIMQGCMVTEEL